MGAVSLAALKQARYRARQRTARAVYRTEADADRLADALVRSGRLAEADVWRRDRIERALSEMIDEWIAEVL